MGNRMTSLTNKALDKAIQKTEQIKEEAIRETDWDETAVLDIVEYQPVPNVPNPERTNLKLGLKPQAHRYSTRAPPLDTYADGRKKYSVTRITKPLLEAKNLHQYI